MQLSPEKDLIYLSSSHSLPSYLKKLSGVRIRQMKTLEELKSFLATKTEYVIVIIQSPSLSLRTAQAFLSWGQLKLRWSFIFISQTIEKAVYQLANQGHPILILQESDDGEKIAETLTRRILGGLIKSRRQERQSVQSPVMVKKSAYSKK